MSIATPIQDILRDAVKAYADGDKAHARDLLVHAIDLDPGNPAARGLVTKLFPGGLAAVEGGAGRGGGASPWVEDNSAGGAADLALDQTSPWGFPAMGPGPGGGAVEVDLGLDEGPSAGSPGAEDDDPAQGQLGGGGGAGFDLLSSGQGAGFSSGLAAPTPVPGPYEPPVAPSDAGEQEASEVDQLLGGARDLMELADFTGALELIEKALELEPVHPTARSYLEKTQGTLVQMHESRLGDLERSPSLRVNPDEVVWLNLDHRAGFVLAQIDGLATVEDLFALSGMSRLDTCRILVQLLDEGVIALEG